MLHNIQVFMQIMVQIIHTCRTQLIQIGFDRAEIFFPHAEWCVFEQAAITRLTLRQPPFHITPIQRHLNRAAQLKSTDGFEQIAMRRTNTCALQEERVIGEDQIDHRGVGTRAQFLGDLQALQCAARCNIHHNQIQCGFSNSLERILNCRRVHHEIAGSTQHSSDIVGRRARIAYHQNARFLHAHHPFAHLGRRICLMKTVHNVILSYYSELRTSASSSAQNSAFG